MKPFRALEARAPQEAAALSRQLRREGRSVAFAGGGSDLFGLVKDDLVRPDVVLRVSRLQGLDSVAAQPDGGLRAGGAITLDALSRHPLVRERFPVLAEAAGAVGTPQIRNVATLAGNLCQRPWCWYFRNGFPCYKNGGDRCFAPGGENEHHAIFGHGPSHIVHPSDTAVALAALGASLRLVAPDGERVLPASRFFVMPDVDPSRENVLGPDELVAEILLPPPPPGARSAYLKVMDREAWTHAVVSVAASLTLADGTCRHVGLALGGVAPVPWRLPRVERLLEGRRLTPELAREAGERAVEGARPLSDNAYKVPLVKAAVRRLLGQLTA